MKSKTVLWIKADTNDADYVTSENVVQEGDLEIIRKVCKVITDNRSKCWHNWTTGDNGSPYSQWALHLDQYEIEVFDEYVPYGEYGIHSIEAVELREVTVLEKFI